MKNKITFSTEFTRKIAELSNLKLTDGEIELFSKQFNSTLVTISNLNKVDTSSVKPAYSVTGLKNVFREDVIDKSRLLSQKEALSNAKRTYKGFFVVKGILNEE